MEATGMWARCQIGDAHSRAMGSLALEKTEVTISAVLELSTVAT